MKKYGLILLVLLILVGCNKADNNVGNSNTGTETEQVGIALSKDSTENDLKQFMLEVFPKAENLSRIVFYTELKLDESDVFNYQPLSDEAMPIEMAKVDDSKVTSLKDLDNMIKDIFSEEVYVNSYRPELYDLGIVEPHFVEKDGKLYASLFTSYVPFYQWNFDNIEILYATDEKIAFFADASISYSGDEEELVETRGKIVLVNEDGKWKLGTNMPQTDSQPFNKLNKELYGEDILSTREEALAVIKEKAYLDNFPNKFEDYIWDFDQSFMYTKNLDGSFEPIHMVWARMYEMDGDKLNLLQKAQVAADGSVANLSFFDQYTDYFITTDYNYGNTYGDTDAPENLFGYIIVNLSNDATKEDYYMKMSNIIEAELDSDIVYREALSEDFKSMMFIVPKFIGTKITIYDANGEPRKIISDDIPVVIGKHKDISKVKIEANGQEIEFKPAFEKDAKIKFGTNMPLNFEY